MPCASGDCARTNVFPRRRRIAFPLGTEPASLKSMTHFSSGLDGVVAGSTGIALLDHEHGRIFYRGYNLDWLVENKSYMEVVYLLWCGHWPSPDQLELFETTERAYRALSPGLVSLLRAQGGSSPT